MEINSPSFSKENKEEGKANSPISRSKSKASKLFLLELNSPTLSRKSISKIEVVPPASSDSRPLIKNVYSIVHGDQSAVLNDHFNLDIKMDEDYKLSFISPKYQ